VERSLVDHVVRGERLDLVPIGETVDETVMRSWGESRTISAAVIRDIMRRRLAPDPDPHGLRLRGAKITGRLDLENLTTDVNLRLEDCLLEEGARAVDARLASVSLLACRLESPGECPLEADRLTCKMLDLRWAKIISHSDSGAVRLYGAHIDGDLACDEAVLRNDSGPALDAEGLQVGQSMFMREGFTATGTGEFGAVRLLAAHIGGHLACEGATLVNGSGPALMADGLQVGQGMFLNYRFSAIGAGSLGAVRLAHAHIGVQLSCVEAACATTPAPPWKPRACRSARA
jgi:hypothetical protein